MAAQQPLVLPVLDYQSEDEDSTVDYQEDQFPDVVDPAYTIGVDPSLDVDNWVPRDPTGWEYYIPTWTRPGYHDQVEVSGDGSKERPRMGNPQEFMRPALLPTDPAASQYAK